MLPHSPAPIETTYAGCRFRSRLEARWAVFFDHLRVPWEYEPEAFATSAGNYLPDFRIMMGFRRAVHPQWFEVKPPGAPDDSRHITFASEIGSLIVARGMPRDHAHQRGHLTWIQTDPFTLDVLVEPGKAFQAANDGHVDMDAPQRFTESWRVDEAYAAARSARFGS